VEAKVTTEINDNVIDKENKTIGDCSYHLCNKEKIEVFTCSYCNKHFCADHIKPKCPKPPFGDSKHYELEKRTNYHPCKEYYEFVIQKEIEHEKKIVQSIDKMPKGPPFIVRHKPYKYVKNFPPYSKGKVGKTSIIYKCSFCSYTTENLTRCKYCGDLFCEKHIEPKTRSDFLRTKGGHSCDRLPERKPIEQSNELQRKPLYKNSNRFISWFFWKKHPHSGIRSKDFLIQIVSIIILSLLFWLVYSYSSSSKVLFWVLNLTAIFEICLIILIIYFTYKLLINLRFGIRGLANGFKLIAAVVVLLFCSQIVLQPGVITEPITQFNYATLNPLELDLINQNNGDTTNNYDYNGDSTNNNDNNDIVIPLPNSKPSINIAELETEIHVLINNERQKNGIPTLQYDTELSDIARGHSRDMATRNYFEHINPEGDGPTERAIKAGYNVHKELGGGYYSDGIGENIFQNNLYDSVTYYNGIPVYDWNSQSEIAITTVDGWMNSPGHRQNIINSGYNKEGIGVAISSDDKVYITEDFW